MHAVEKDGSQLPLAGVGVAAGGTGAAVHHPRQSVS